MMLAAFLVITATLAAQQTTTTGWMMYSDTIGRSLELTPDQEERIRDWNARYQREQERMAPDGLDDRDREPLDRRREEELRGILTPEQYTRWNEMARGRDQHGSTGTGGSPGPEMRRGIPPTP
jgi:Spy/CpxP family protein refolding chaperone